MNAPSDFDFAAVLSIVAERQASDLHLTAGAPPAIREKGKVDADGGLPGSSPRR